MTIYHKGLDFYAHILKSWQVFDLDLLQEIFFWSPPLQPLSVSVYFLLNFKWTNGIE